jgi:hypothetical protein
MQSQNMVKLPRFTRLNDGKHIDLREELIDDIHSASSLVLSPTKDVKWREFALKETTKSSTL